jgi:hypothetical protein
VEDKTKPCLNAEQLRELCIIFKQKTRDLYVLQAEIQTIRKKITTLSTENDLKGTYNGVRVQIRHLFPQKENLEIAKQSGVDIPLKEIEDLAKLREVAIENGIPIPIKYKEDYLKLKHIFSEKGIEGFYKKNVALTILNKEELQQ